MNKSTTKKVKSKTHFSNINCVYFWSESTKNTAQKYANTLSLSTFNHRLKKCSTLFFSAETMPISQTNVFFFLFYFLKSQIRHYMYTMFIKKNKNTHFIFQNRDKREGSVSELLHKPVHWLSSYSDNVGYCRFLPKFLLIFHPRKISFRIIFTQNLVTIVNFRPGFYRALGAGAGEGGLGNQWGGWGAYSD